MSLVLLKTLLFGAPPRRQRDIESSSSASSPLLPATTVPIEPHVHENGHEHSYTCLESDFTTKPAPAPSNLCPNPDCPRIRRPRSSSASTTSVGPSPKPWLDPRTVSDAIIGLSDGLTVPFALTAGLSAFNDTRVVLYGGVAELIAGSISMGLGGWLAGRGEAAFYASTLAHTKALVEHQPEGIPALIHGVFAPYQLPPSAVAPLAAALLCDPIATVDFLMSFHHSLPAPSSKRTPLSSALTIAAGYFLGGFVPLLPYFWVAQTEVLTGLWWSVGTMAICLFLFGVGRTVAVGEGGKGGRAEMVRGGVEMMSIGGVAAGASWGIVRALGQGGV
ncbi:VIT family-domain-containing protein [Geopyxis carbonaria]|nr:VIT family-domain-containing protein [Geopyxis carbonaria]